MLLISIALATIPLAGIAWIVLRGSITTVDGLFMSLILLSLSGIFYLNIVLELRERQLFPFARKSKSDDPKRPPTED
jgi:hypothetical protein